MHELQKTGVAMIAGRYRRGNRGSDIKKLTGSRGLQGHGRLSSAGWAPSLSAQCRGYSLGWTQVSVAVQRATALSAAGAWPVASRASDRRSTQSNFRVHAGVWRRLHSSSDALALHKTHV